MRPWPKQVHKEVGMTSVLVVDDEASVREGLKLALSGEFTVSTAASAEEAFEKISRWHPETMVLDQNMPGLSGTGLLEKLAFGEAPATVFLSGRADVKLARQAMHLGAEDLLSKPCDIGALKLSLRQAAARVRGGRHEESPLALRAALAMRHAADGGGSLDEQTRRCGRAMVAEAVAECRGDRVSAAVRLGLSLPELVGLEADFAGD